LNGIRLGQVDYLNCYPVYYAIEHDQVPVNAKMFKGYPTKLNEMFLNGKLDITPISSIEYARNLSVQTVMFKVYCFSARFLLLNWKD